MVNEVRVFYTFYQAVLAEKERLLPIMTEALDVKEGVLTALRTGVDKINRDVFSGKDVLYLSPRADERDRLIIREELELGYRYGENCDHYQFLTYIRFTHNYGHYDPCFYLWDGWNKMCENMPLCEDNAQAIINRINEVVGVKLTGLVPLFVQDVVRSEMEP